MSKVNDICFSGLHHYLRPHEEGRRLVVFFGAKDLSYERYNFFQTGRELSEHCLFLNNGANHWYQYGIQGLGKDVKSTLETIIHWRDFLKAEEILTIGTSMGAYGAIQYGAALGARVLAFASDAKLGAKHTQSARYFTPDGPPECSDLCHLLTQKPTDVTLLAGERDAVDLHSAWQLSKVEGVRAISLVGANHIVPTFLSRRARLGPLLRSFVDGKDIPEQADAGDALMHDDYVKNIFSAFDAAQTSNWSKSEARARKALKSYPYGEAGCILLGQALLKQGRAQAALPFLATCVVSQPDDIDAKMLLAYALRSCGSLAQARNLYYQILEQNPHTHRAWYGLGLIALKSGDLSGSAKSLRAALGISKNNAKYKALLASIDDRLAGK